jgi:alpha-L-rhamnosidase
VARTATLLSKNAEAAEYLALQKRIREAFNAAFYKGDGLYANGSQTALSCALYQGLAEPLERPKVLAQLIANIEKQGWHLDTGILGAKYVPNTLTDMGRADVAYRLATQTTPPSYGAWVKQGATTLWEDWYGGASLDHIMFGDISAWFYKTLAGINLDPERPGFKHIIIRPRPVGDLIWVKASHRSPYGVIECDWRRDQGVFSLSVALPINTTAMVYVPAVAAGAVREGDGLASKSRCVRFVRMEDGCAVYEVGSGTYRFESRGQ